MSVKYVKEYTEEMCAVCNEFKYGLFVVVHDNQICKDCCNNISKQLKIFEIENG